MRHIDRCALVAHIDDAYALGVELHPDRHDVAATQAIHPLHAPGLEKSGNHCCTGVLRRRLKNHIALPGLKALIIIEF